MDSLKAALSAYLITIIFSLLIAAVLPLLGKLVKRLRLDDEVVDLSVPTTNSMKEEEGLAVAIAVARAQRK